MDFMEWIKNEGHTYISLAEMLGVTKWQVSRIARFKQPPRLKLAQKIVALTEGKVQMNDIFKSA